MREEHAGLADFAEALAVKLAHQDCQSYRHNNAQNLEYQIVQDGQLKDQSHGVTGEQQLEVVEADPFTLHQVVEKAPPCFHNAVVLKGNNNTEHRQERKADVPDDCWQRQQRQFCVVAVPTKLPFFLFGLRLHKTTPFPL